MKMGGGTEKMKEGWEHNWKKRKKMRKGI